MPFRKWMRSHPLSEDSNLLVILSIYPDFGRCTKIMQINGMNLGIGHWALGIGHWAL
ncbi:MAG: hypothetical protein HC903_02990 [Methylacidiphilales bacterium]|nr:hypothetical protein [Candidatus Methylacidiphilales bacterium]NJR14539.1 hypothetical protein [Calothrix sp. CSU_2_0]